ncbi:helix-turn-helix domain-containing protein [Streptomyces sp. NPDC047841]|uniref:helix-turn-helix domain-containing protein n=1 Tax=Streptomyces sp. NPDC047841 TaxID=3154708 RepID=UPI0034553615
MEHWCVSGGSADATARSFSVHPNTVRYRLRRVDELTGRSLPGPRATTDIDAALLAGPCLGRRPTTGPRSRLSRGAARIQTCACPVRPRRRTQSRARRGMPSIGWKKERGGPRGRRDGRRTASHAGRRRPSTPPHAARGPGRPRDVTVPRPGCRGGRRHARLAVAGQLTLPSSPQWIAVLDVRGEGARQPGVICCRRSRGGSCRGGRRLP